jgi:probable F420-dependent oxidoreductase
MAIGQDAPMRFDLMTGATTWREAAQLARDVEGAGFSGMLFTETTQTPWMSIAAAATAAPSLVFTTGISVAFARSPMVAAGLAWELAENTEGRFRLGLGSQVKAHVERRYGAEFAPPGPRMRDYLEAVQACLRAFRGDERLAHDGTYYKLSLLPPEWAPRRHAFGDIKVDVSAVGPWMCRMAGAVADGIHVHPFHSMPYLHDRLLPAVADGAAEAGRSPGDVDLIIPVFAIPGDTPEERAALIERARFQIAFYGSTRNYAFQFDDLGFEGTSARLNERMKAGDLAGMAALITDEMLEHYAVITPWDDLADALLSRYRGVAARLVMYLAEQSIRMDPPALGRWGEVARAVTTAA